MIKISLFILAVLSFIGCASVSLSNKADSVSLGQDGLPSPTNLEFSWELNPDLSSEYFAYFNFNILNTSDKWHTLTGMRIVLPDSTQNKNIRVVLGKELEEWYKAQKKVMEIADFNAASASLLVAGVGAGLSAMSDNKYVKGAGGAMMLGTLGYLTVDAFGAARDSLRLSSMIPKNHLLADSIMIPPGLFTDRWVLLNSTDHEHLGFVDTLSIEYRLEDGSIQSNRLVLRKKFGSLGRRKWQASYFATHIQTDQGLVKSHRQTASP